MPNIETEKRVISEWVLLQKNRGIIIDDIEWRDTRQRKGDIEAIASPFAIEHTSIDRLKNQRRHIAQFKQIVQDFYRIVLSPPARLSLSISLDDFIRVDHKKLQAGLAQWLRKEASELDEGHHKGIDICGISVRWWCWKYKDRPPRIIIGLLADTEKHSNKIGSLLKKKSIKLGGYKRQSFTTVLIVESCDIQLMAPEFFLEMILGVPEENRTFIDQIWFADTTLKDIEFWRVIPETRYLDGPYNSDAFIS
jgi:hypothetical protein